MRHHKEVWKQKFKLIFTLMQLSEMHGAERVKVKKKILGKKCTVSQKFLDESSFLTWSQAVLTCSKSTMETPKQCVKSVQS